MAKKLTLYVEENLMESAKAYAKERGKSLSKIVSDLLSLLLKDKKYNLSENGTKTYRLRGLLKESHLDESDYRRHLEEKYL